MHERKLRDCQYLSLGAVQVNCEKVHSTFTWDEIDKPVQLVKPNEQHKKLMLVDENVKVCMKVVRSHEM